MKQRYNVLFLCTGNSARSIMAEAIMNSKGWPVFSAYSAGSHPSGTVRPEAIALLESSQVPTEGLRSKSWEEFTRPGAPQFDFILTVCDHAAREGCPVWPGQPITAHWGVPDPVAFRGTAKEIEHAYREAFVTLERRIDLFLQLPRSTILQMKVEIERIGQQQMPLRQDFPT